MHDNSPNNNSRTCQNFRSVDFRNFCTPVHFPRAPEQKLDSEAFFSHTSQALTLRFNVCTWDVWCKPSSNSNRKVIFFNVLRKQFVKIRELILSYSAVYSGCISIYSEEV